MSARIIGAKNGMEEAAARLRAGELVAFPTETVYGLGANALDAEAVAKIFRLKGRPSTNPLIVHVPDLAAARVLAAEWPEAAQKLAEAFWPGPLTLVVPKTDAVPEIVTAGGPTVALRVPNHPVALALLHETGLPLAAPSANRSEEVSPTRASHVADSLGPFSNNLLILNGKPCEVGIESTVLDMTQTPPRILRPGRVTMKELEVVVGEVTQELGPSNIARSPGQGARHYAPKTPVVLLPSDQITEELLPDDCLLYIRGQTFVELPPEWLRQRKIGFPMSANPFVYERYLYNTLRAADRGGFWHIVVEEPPGTPEWTAVWDRLRRAEFKGATPHKKGIL